MASKRSLSTVVNDVSFPDSVKISWPQMPDWVPPLVQEQARLTWHENTRTPQAASLAIRLASSSKMKIVWKEFSKKDRGSEEYLYPVNPSFKRYPDYKKAKRKLHDFLEFRKLNGLLTSVLKGSGHNSLRAQSLWHFYLQAFVLAYEWRPALLTRQEAKLRAAPFLRLAPHLETAADLLKRYKIRKEDQALLRELATLFKQTADNSWRPNTYFASNKKRDPDMRAFAMALSKESRRLFGSSPLGTIGNVTSTVFEIDLSDDLVRSILKSELESVDF
jgi:hypothetical protein